MKKPSKKLMCGRKIEIHLITVAEFLYRYAFLLIIPILQYLIVRPQGILEMFTTGGMNVLLAAAVVVYAVLRYRCRNVRICKGKIIAEKGVFYRTKTVIYEKRLVGAAIRQGAITAIFGACTLCISTGEGRLSVVEYIRKRHMELPLLSVYGTVIRAGLFHSFVAAADATSALSGLLLIIPFLRKTAPVIGGALSEGFYGGVDLWSGIVSKVLPPAAAYISGLIAAGYAFAFIYELLKHLKMRIVKNDESIKISRGFVWRFSAVQPRAEISALTMEQGILCRVLGIKKVFVLSSLFKCLGAERELISVKTGRLKKPKSDIVTPNKGSVFSFIMLPALLLVSAVAAAFYFQSEGKAAAVSIILSIAVPILMFWVLLRAAAFEQTFLWIDDSGVFAGSFSGLRLVQVCIDKDRVNMIEIRQSLIQRFFGSCNVRVYAHNRRKPFLVRRIKRKGCVNAALSL
ncbi:MULTISPECIES: PH domain-containing protein [unclassified Ruminococcus]|uniref:PH domain-containing protein n=1 Tax=unclassified Ruminococcus TaxID=2608920 RepID=UPI002109E7B1|nr:MULTISPECIES: PH domain-containing protein [unclassified Ruminococcus]MCQ4021481.1 hypothetical protein [Ruminococcus sp. zg-924]MCQ4113926.1 hypothetical protein [Ruminococcus sp. zg-921]